MIIDGLIERVIGLKITFDNLNDFILVEKLWPKLICVCIGLANNHLSPKQAILVSGLSL
jgi:hypothetical protein